MAIKVKKAAKRRTDPNWDGIIEKVCKKVQDWVNINHEKSEQGDVSTLKVFFNFDEIARIEFEVDGTITTDKDDNPLLDEYGETYGNDYSFLEEDEDGNSDPDWCSTEDEVVASLVAAYQVAKQEAEEVEAEEEDDDDDE